MPANGPSPARPAVGPRDAQRLAGNTARPAVIKSEATPHTPAIVSPGERCRKGT
ncbi:MAG: hypothetical protein L0332_33555 [Chloroflexi bacterium]|nr:hypothetical protein [Chloroflexota bacterium]